MRLEENASAAGSTDGDGHSLGRRMTVRTIDARSVRSVEEAEAVTFGLTLERPPALPEMPDIAENPTSRMQESTRLEEGIEAHDFFSAAAQGAGARRESGRSSTDGEEVYLGRKTSVSNLV